MESPKAISVRLLATLSDEASWETILDRLTTRAQIERARESVRQGRVISNEHVEEEMDAWLASHGPSMPESISA